MKRVFPIVLLLLAGCDGSSPESPQTPEAIRIQPLLTRVTGTNFDREDRIGLTVSVGDVLYADNRELVYDGTTFSSSGLIWYNDMTLTSILTAYYPYDPAGSPTRFTVPADQSGAGFAAADLLAAVRHSVQPTVAPVEMVFDHLLSKLRIEVDNRSDGTIADMAVEGLIPTATVDLDNRLVTVDPAASPMVLVPHSADDAATGEVIVIPQMAAITLRIATDDGKEHAYELEPTVLQGGRIYTVRVVVTNIDIACTLAGEITDWTDGGTIAERTEGLTYAGVTYGQTRMPDGSIWLTENLQYNPGGAYFPGEALTDVASVQRYGLLYDSETAQTACPEGWGLPTAEDFEALIRDWDSVDPEFLTRTPAVRLASGSYKSYTDRCYLWSSSADGSGFHQALAADYSGSAVELYLERKSDQIALPVRCRKL